MREAILTIGALLLFLLVAGPWFSIFDWVQKERGKKGKSRSDVV